MKPSEKDITELAAQVRAVRPEWRDWAIRDALRHAIRAGYAGTADRQSLGSYALFIAGQTNVQSPMTMKWPEHWRAAAEFDEP